MAEAYEVLSDPERRALYDAYGHEGLRAGGAADAGFGRARGAGGAAGGGVPAYGHFVDPFELFLQAFGGRDPFAELFGAGNSFHDPFAASFGGFGADPFFGGGMAEDRSRQPTVRGRPTSFVEQMMGGMMGAPFGGMSSLAMGGAGGRSSSMNFSSSSSFGGSGGGVSRSMSSSTVIRNGRSVTRTTTTITHADGSQTTETRESVDDGGLGHGGGGGFGALPGYF